MIKVLFLRLMVRLVGWFYWRNKAPPNFRVSDRSIPVRDSEIKIRTYTPGGQGPFPYRKNGPVWFQRREGWMA